MAFRIDFKKWFKHSHKYGLAKIRLVLWTPAQKMNRLTMSLGTLSYQQSNLSHLSAIQSLKDFLVKLRIVFWSLMCPLIILLLELLNRNKTVLTWKCYTVRVNALNHFVSFKRICVMLFFDLLDSLFAKIN